MEIIGNGKNKLHIHVYKGYKLIKNGTLTFPWNVYAKRVNPYTRKIEFTHVGYERTIAHCKASIDAGLYEEEGYEKS